MKEDVLPYEPCSTGKPVYYCSNQNDHLSLSSIIRNGSNEERIIINHTCIFNQCTVSTIKGFCHCTSEY